MKHHTMAIITLLLINISVMMSAGASISSGGGEVEGIAPGGTSRAFDWEGWDRDIDNDRVDDILTTDIPVVEAVEGTIGINVHFQDGADDGSTSRMIRAAEGLGFEPELVYSGKYSTARYLRVRHLDILSYRALASFEGVTMVEYRPWMVPFLDVSTKGIRASPSEEYSPYTASELGYTGEGVNIAMMDSGADDMQHESLLGKFVTGGDFTGTVTVNNVNPPDKDGHGTHTAGIALGTGGQSGAYAGVAPGSGLVDLKIFKFFGGDASNSDHAFEWLIENHAEHGIKVVSCSFGSSYTTSGQDTTSRLVNQLVDEGVVVVVAAGNDGSQGLPSPAAADKAITVGALNDKDTVTRSDDGYAGYSNYGPRASDGDSDQMDELKPDILASGTDIRSAQYNTIMAYSEKTGTSMSCPHVSGAVALMFEANPDLTPDQVKQIIRETAQQTGSGSRPALDDRYNYRSGWGFIDVYGAVKRSEDLGSYRVDGPAEVIGGETIDLELSGELSRTDLTSHIDQLSIEIRVPSEWGPIEDQDLDAGSPNGISTLEEPILVGSMWRVKGTITYDQPFAGVEPTLSLRIKAPMEMGSRATIQGLISINGMEGSVRALNITVSSEAEPADLSIIPVAIWFSSNRPDSGDDVEITVKVNNTGGTTARNFLIRLLDGPARTGALIGEEESTISSGGSGIVSFIWEASAGVHAITAVADPNDDIAETNELNNSAERPITVLGINPPPVAELTADRTSTNTLTEVTFDGSGSYDTNVRGGAVTQYLFDFGDGETSGWVNLSSVQHRYRTGGSFRAVLTVKDNGGATSSNDASVMINVTELASDSTRLYLLNSSALSEDIGERGSTEIPATTGGVEYVGAWTSSPAERSLVLHSRIRIRLELGSKEECNVDIEAHIVFSGETIVISGDMALTSPLPNYFEAEAGIEDMRLDRGEEITLEIFAGSNASSSYLVTGGPGSYIEILHYPVSTGTPIADAGPDREVKALDAVTFVGHAEDEDGEIISVRWDVDGDGIYEIEGENAYSFTYSGYPEPGNYIATFEAMDEDGEWGRDSASVLVRPSDYNFPPEVHIDLGNGTRLEGIVTINGGASDDAGIEYVEVRTVGPHGGVETTGEWSMADGRESWTFQLDTTRIANGIHSLQARSHDGERYSEIDERSIEVENPNRSPEIVDSIIEPSVLPVDGITQLMIYVEVQDLDLPDEVIHVTADLSSIGGEVSFDLVDDGTGVDEFGGDLVYSNSFIPPIGTPSGTYSIPVRAADSFGGHDEIILSLDLESQIDVDCRFSTFRPSRGGELKIDVDISPFGTYYTVELTGMGMFEEENIMLLDDGQDGDRVAGDGTYSRIMKVTGPPGMYVVMVDVRDGGGNLLWSSSYDVDVREGSDLSSAGTGSEAVSPLLVISLIVLLLVFAAGLLAIVYRMRSTEGVPGEQPGAFGEQPDAVVEVGPIIDPYHGVVVEENVETVAVETVSAMVLEQAPVQGQVP